MENDQRECTAFFHAEGATAPYDFAPPPEWSKVVLAALGITDHSRPSGVLDVGCGPGQFLNALHLAGVSQLIGLDSSAIMLNKARHNSIAYFPLVQADASALPFASNSFQLILFRYLLHHLLHPDIAISEAARTLRLEGWLAIETADPLVLQTQPEYLDYPSVASIDLPRWPTKSAIVDWMTTFGLAFQRCLPIRLIRDRVPKGQYLSRLGRWVLDGGGTSFWRLLDHDQRYRHFQKTWRELAMAPDDYLVPIESNGILIVGMKTAVSCYRSLDRD